MGSNPSRPSSRKYLLALLHINGHASSGINDSEVSQGSAVIFHILQHIFQSLLNATELGERGSQLTTVSLVNRHWSKVAQSIRYTSVTITSHKALQCLVRTLDAQPQLRSWIVDVNLDTPFVLPTVRTHNSAGIRMSSDQLAREEERIKMAHSRTVLHFLELLTAARSLRIHAKVVPLLIHAPDGPVHPPPFPNLDTLTHLELKGLHDGRWLFLLKYTTALESLTCSPAWHATDSPALPFASLQLHTLRLIDGNRLDHEHFIQLTRKLRVLELVDVPYIMDPAGSDALIETLTSLSGTLEKLYIYSSNAARISRLTDALNTTLPQFTTLDTLETNAWGLRSVPPNVKSLTISLAEDRILGSRIKRPVGTIYETVTRILTLAESGAAPKLKKLRVEDATMEDFLHFHLAGSCDYGDEGEAYRQRTLWMTAGRLGILVDVDKIKNWRGEPAEDGQVHSLDDE